MLVAAVVLFLRINTYEVIYLVGEVRWAMVPTTSDPAKRSFRPLPWLVGGDFFSCPWCCFAVGGVVSSMMTSYLPPPPLFSGRATHCLYLAQMRVMSQYVGVAKCFVFLFSLFESCNFNFSLVIYIHTCIWPTPCQAESREPKPNDLCPLLLRCIVWYG